MRTVVVGISDCRVSGDTECCLITYGLGSCIAVVAYEPVRKLGGMLHYMLPDSSLDLSKAASNPFMFADTGIQLLFERFRALGADPRNLAVALAGGAQVLDPGNLFGIGRRNYLAAKKALWKIGAFIGTEAIGGDLSRTVRLDIGTGRSWLREGSQPENELGHPKPSGRSGAAEQRSQSALPSRKLVFPSKDEHPSAAKRATPKGANACRCAY
jgi:chemotaxis protein CheD